MHGWAFAAGYGEVMNAVHASAFMNSNRDQKKHPQPIELPMPWQKKDAPDVSAQERAALRKTLERNSAFAA